MSQIGFQELVELTGFTYPTVKKRCASLIKTKLEGSKKELVNSSEALPLVYEVGGGAKRTYEDEKIKLTAAQAEKTELEVEVMKGSLVPREQIDMFLSVMLSSFRARMLSLPTKAAHALIGVMDINEVEEILKEYVNEGLSELSNYDPSVTDDRDIEAGGEDNSAATKANGKPVGRQGEAAIKRGKRRARTVEH